MRPIIARYAGECRKCLAPIAVGEAAIYERRVGMFCPACAPTDPEEIRELRQEGADRKADRLQDWADKRKATAGATLTHIRNHYTGDIAFNTQPGHIPLRARILGQQERAWESLQVADKFEERAASLRSGVRVKGDAETRRQGERDFVKARIAVGMVVETAMYGTGTVKRINKKTATIEGCGCAHDYTTTVDLSFIIPPRKAR